MPTRDAFLEFDGRQIPLSPAFKIGRSRSCALELDDDGASREHVLIVRDEGRGAWLLMDLGSTNGTRLNDTLIARASVLHSGDRVGIGSQTLTFHDPDSTPISRPSTIGATLLLVNPVSRWFLLGDVKGSTRLWNEVPEPEVSRRMRAWVRDCAAVIETSGGWINEYLGDGFLAVWRVEDVGAAQMALPLSTLEGMHGEGGLDFRFVVHRATVQSGAGVSSGIEKLAGPELNFLFKSEKVVAAWNRRLVLTCAAAEALGGCVTLREVGMIEIDGFGPPQPAYAADWRRAANASDIA
jgi:class 3 adenylate cyclase